MQGNKFDGAQDTLSQSLSAATTGTGTAIPFHNCRQVAWSVEGAGTISGGTVVIESAPTATYAGTWNELDSVTASSLTGGAVYNATTPGPLQWVRGRISSNITGGGTVTVRLNGLLS